jgi:Xaa-Pro aminopeptidase
MEHDLLGARSKHCDILVQLEDREPATFIEAQAVIENIRAKKSHLDEDILRELHTLSQRSQEALLKVVKLNRKQEADYTKRYDSPSC